MFRVQVRGEGNEWEQGGDFDTLADAEAALNWEGGFKQERGIPFCAADYRILELPPEFITPEERADWYYQRVIRELAAIVIDPRDYLIRRAAQDMVRE